MDGLSRAGGVGATLKLGGESLQVSPRLLRHYGEIEAEVAKRRGNPFDLIRDAKDLLKDDPAMMRDFIERAFDEARRSKIVTPGDVQEFMESTWSGSCFVIWLAVRDNDRSRLTLDVVSRMFADEFEDRLRKDGPDAAAKWQAEIHGTINAAGGEDELGNSTGSPPSGNQESVKPSIGT